MKAKQKPHFHWGTILLVAAMCAMILSYFFLVASGDCVYTIVDNGKVYEISSRSSDIDGILREAGISLSEGDQVTVEAGSSKTYVDIQRSQQILLQYGGAELTATTYGTTVQELLQEMNICLGKGDTITSQGKAVSLGAETYDGMTLKIGTITTTTRSELVAVPYETVTYLDPSLEKGETQVKTYGVDGKNQLVYQDTYVDGVLESSTLSGTNVVQEAVDEVLLVGTLETPVEREEAVEIYVEPTPSPAPTPTPTPTPSSTPVSQPSYTTPAEPSKSPEPEYTAPTPSGNTITTYGGEVISYTRALSVTATAYTGGGTTATGTSARYGAIAVDPSVIPYGTRMYIVSDDGKYIYGYATAEDCGGAVKGNIIDLYFDSYDACIQFGRRSCTVYILD